MANATAPVRSTGNTTPSNTKVEALRKRLETLELQVKRLNANRTPPATLVHQLSNAGPMRKVADGDTLVYNEATGQYEPGSTGYASLTGAGQTATPGLLTQKGGFIIDTGDVGVDATEVIEFSATSADSAVGAFFEMFALDSGAQMAMEVFGGGPVPVGNVSLFSDPTHGTILELFAGVVNIGGGFSPSEGVLTFFNTNGSNQQTVTGSQGGNTALANLIQALKEYGLIIDATTP